MNLTILAQQAAQQAPTGIQSIFSNPMFMLVILAVLFWVLLIRPQRKAQKEQQARLSALQKGDKVITSAGIHGTIIYVDTTTVTVQISENVNVILEKSAIVHVQKKDGASSK
ncbi:MAG: preprotein translocase subunit YajC [Akkermansia sp.]